MLFNQYKNCRNDLNTLLRVVQRLAKEFKLLNNVIYFIKEILFNLNYVFSIKKGTMSLQEMTYELRLDQVFNSQKGNDAKTGRHRYDDVSVVSTDRCFQWW